MRALLQYRNTPSRRDGLSPAQKLFGKPIQDSIPAHHRIFAPQWQKAFVEDHFFNITSTEDYYNQHAHPLPEITVGTNVAIQNPTTKRWDILYGTVVAVGPYRRYRQELQWSSLGTDVTSVAECPLYQSHRKHHSTTRRNKTSHAHQPFQDGPPSNAGNL